MLGHLLEPAGFAWPEGQVQEGSRNSTILRYAGHLRARGYAEEDILVLAMDANRKWFSPPLDEAEVASVCRRYARDAQPSDYSSLAANDGYFRVPSDPPPPRQYVLGQQVTAGTVCVLGGSGGTMKTMLVLQMAVAGAVGKDYLGDLRVGTGSSLIFLGEEDDAERDRRIGAICATFSADRELVSRRIMCFGSAGQDLRLTRLTDGTPDETPLAEQVIELARSHADRSGAPLRFIVFDHARLVMAGDPNAADHVTALTRVLTRIARSTGAAVFLLAHSPKMTMGKQGHEINASDVAGSSAFVDNARAGFMQWSMRDGEGRKYHVYGERSRYIRVEVMKANYGPVDTGWWFRKEPVPGWDVAVLKQVRLSSGLPFEGKAKSALRERILELVQRKPGSMTERRVRDLAGKDGELEASEGRVRAEVRSMIEEGVLEARAPTADERRRYKLAMQMKQVLVVSDDHGG